MPAAVLSLAALQGLEAQVFLRGDSNTDGEVTISDAHFSLSFLFRGNAAPQCRRASDVNGDGHMDISDAIQLLSHLFLGGPSPCHPYPMPGVGHPDEEEPCELYLPRPKMEDPGAVMEVSHAIAGPDGRTVLNLLIASSRDLGGYAAALRLEGGGFGRVLRTSELSGTLIGGFLSARAFGSRIHIGFLNDITGSGRLPASEGQPVLQLEVCLEPGIKAGDLRVLIDAPELVDHQSGRAILPATVEGTLSVPVDVGDTGCKSPDVPQAGRGCKLPPMPDPPPPPGGPKLDFARGDVNFDGRLSTADALWLRRFLFDDGPAPRCADAADADDDGKVDAADMAFIIEHLHRGGPPPPPPFLAQGPDPTADDHGCASNQVTPPSRSEKEELRLGELAAVPGWTVEVPIFLTSASEVDAFQLVLRFDPAVFRPQEGPEGIGLEGGPFEKEGIEAAGALLSVRRLPGHQDILLVGFVPHLRSAALDLPPGEERLIFTIRGTIDPGASPGTATKLTLTDGPGEAGFGPLSLRNELGSLGRTRLPRLLEGVIRIIEMGAILRGDCDHDGKVDVSDGIYLLSHLFLAGPPPPCPDEADADDGGALDVSDAINVLNTLFLGSASIAPPFPVPGPDPTVDGLAECTSPVL